MSESDNESHPHKESPNGERPSSIEDVFQQFNDLSMDDVLAFFEEVAPEAKCPVCSCEELNVYSGVGIDDSGQSMIIKGRPALSGILIHEIPSQGAKMKQAGISCHCIRCGYIMHFLASRILQWKLGNAEEK